MPEGEADSNRSQVRRDLGIRATASKRRRMVYLRRRIFAASLGVVVLALIVFGVIRLVGSVSGDESIRSTEPAHRDVRQSSTTTASTNAPTTTTVEVAAPPVEPDRKQGAEASSARTGLTRIQALGGASMSPKSVVASDRGVVFAQNMMYRHSVSVFDAAGSLVRTIPDAVDLSKFGISGHPGTSKGAPVEMSFGPDGKVAWVSNYSMYGSGFGPEGSDSCVPGDGTDTSFVYRIDVASHEIRKVIAVGAVPKYVRATPDGKLVLVTNWCTWDLSVIDTATNKEIKRVDLGGRYPRGIAVTSDSRTAYVSLMGSDRIVSVDLSNFSVNQFIAPGDSPRHLVISPDDSTLYVTNNRDGNVVKIDIATKKIAGRVSTGTQPRSMDISADGEALYVVNYESASMTKVRASDMTALQSVKTDNHPIGVTYEPTLKRVWVACYGGRVIVFDDSRILLD